MKVYVKKISEMKIEILVNNANIKQVKMSWVKSKGSTHNSIVVLLGEPCLPT